MALLASLVAALAAGGLVWALGRAVQRLRRHRAVQAFRRAEIESAYERDMR